MSAEEAHERCVIGGVDTPKDLHVAAVVDERDRVRPIWSGQVSRENEDEVTIEEFAEYLGAHRQTVYGWLRRGRITGRLATVGTQRIWLVSRAQVSIRTSHREAS